MTTIEIHEGQTTTIEIYNTVTDVQVIEVAVGSLVTTADLKAAVMAAESSASAAVVSASSANSAANSASLSAQSASLNAESAEESSESAFASSDVAQTAATSAAISAQQASASAMLASEVSLQQSFGRKFVPTLSLDATSRTVPSYLPCTRAGVATFFDPSGVLRTAANNEGRIDFDPVTGECLGVLSEGSATNFIINSGTFSSMGEVGVNTVTKLQNTTTSPRNTSAETLTIISQIVGYSRIRQTLSNYTGTRFAYIFAKANTTNFFSIADSTIGSTTIFNLENGTIPTNPNNSGRIQNIGNGWYLCRTILTGNNSFDVVQIGACNSGTSRDSIVGDSVHLFMPYLTEPIASLPFQNPTTIPLTRHADLFATTGFQFAKRYNQREGTFYINTRAISDLTSTVAVFSDGTTDNETRLFANGTLTIRKAGVQIATIQATGATLNEHSIFGFTYKGTRVVITRNGATVGVVTASEELATNYTQFQLGTGIYVRNLRYIPRALSDSELQFVTNPLYFVGLEGDKVPTINDLSSGAFMEVQDLQTLRTRSEITIFGTGALRSIVINRPYPYLIEQVYVSPTGVTTATLPTLPAAGFYAANTDYTVLFNATADRTLVLAIIPQTIN